MKVPFKKLHPNAKTPVYAHTGDSGMDLYVVDDYYIKPSEVVAMDTGIAFEIPEGYEIQIRLRSGVSLTYPLVQPNGVGTIDSGYRGSVKIIAYNMANDCEIKISAGQRIAQAVVCPVVKADLVEVSELSTSSRGEAGYGSTGKF